MIQGRARERRTKEGREGGGGGGGGGGGRRRGGGRPPARIGGVDFSSGQMIRERIK